MRQHQLHTPSTIVLIVETNPDGEVKPMVERNIPCLFPKMKVMKDKIKQFINYPLFSNRWFLMGLWFIIALTQECWSTIEVSITVSSWCLLARSESNFTLYSLSCGILGCESLWSIVLTCHRTFCYSASLGWYVAVVVPNSVAILGYCAFRTTWTAKDFHTLVLWNNASYRTFYAAVQYCCGCSRFSLRSSLLRRRMVGLHSSSFRYVREAIWYRGVGFLPILSASASFVDVTYNMVSRTLLCANAYRFAFVIIGQYEWFHLFSGKECETSGSIQQNISSSGLFAVQLVVWTILIYGWFCLGMALFALPYLRFSQYKNLAFRETILASVLLFVILFGTGSEAGYIDSLVRRLYMVHRCSLEAWKVGDSIDGICLPAFCAI